MADEMPRTNSGSWRALRGNGESHETTEEPSEPIGRRAADTPQAKAMRWLLPAIVGGVLGTGGMFSYLNPVEQARAQAAQTAKDDTQDAAIVALKDLARETNAALRLLGNNQLKVCQRLKVDCKDPQ